ncbi:hypothetical protein [Chlamydia vaughanii]|uniref:hypothetical protein n=1 Tax=Chlamydia vaughanii TaxID=3112552 RepID=UPI0032B2D371
MAISGNSNISPSGPNNWDPSISGKQPEPLPGAKESVFSGTKAASSSKQEALVKSGATANYETDLTINEGKYKKTQEKASSSPKSKLRGAFSKVRAGVQGFLSGFGTRASRVSARWAEANGEGRSMLPSDMDIVKKKGNRISPEMQGFYLDASGFTGTSSDISKLSLESLQATSLSTPLLSASREDISASETSSVASFGSFQMARSVTPETVNSWTVSRLGGEMVSTLLDPNIETSSLLRRASVVGNEGMVDLSNLDQATLSTDMRSASASKNTKIIDSGRDAGTVEEITVDASGVLKESAEEAEKKEVSSDVLKEQMALAKMRASLLASGVPVSVYASSESGWASSATSFPPPKISGTISQNYSDTSKHVSPGIADSKGDTHFSPLEKSMGMVKSLPTSESRSENSYRFPEDPVSRADSMLPSEGASSFSETKVAERVFFPVPEENPSPEYVASAMDTGSDTISSSYLFSSHQGMALLAPLPRSTSEYKEHLEKKKGPGGPPDPLIYQYRNVSIDPPLVLRPPQPFASSSRFSVQGKPEAASVHDDGGGAGGGFSGQNREQGGQNSSEDAKKNKSMDLDLGE